VNVAATPSELARRLAETTTLALEIFPNSSGYVFDAAPVPLSGSNATALQASDPAYLQVLFAKQMVALAEVIESLATTGQLATLNGISILSLSVLPPAVTLLPGEATRPAPVTVTIVPELPLPPGGVTSASSPSKALSTGAIAGIVVGSVAGCILILGLLLVGRKRAELQRAAHPTKRHGRGAKPLSSAPPTETREPETPIEDFAQPTTKVTRTSGWDSNRLQDAGIHFENPQFKYPRKPQKGAEMDEEVEEGGASPNDRSDISDSARTLPGARSQRFLAEPKAPHFPYRLAGAKP